MHGINKTAIYVDAWDKTSHDIDVYSNTIYGNTGGIDVDAEAGGRLERVRIYNNLVYDNAAMGIFVKRGGTTAPSHPLDDIQVFNNTVVHNGTTWGCGIAITNPEATNVAIVNNIVSQNGECQILQEVNPAGLVIDHNLINGYRGSENETRGTNYVEGDPKLDGSYHLLSGSPAINAGAASVNPPVGVDFDFRRWPERQPRRRVRLRGGIIRVFGGVDRRAGRRAGRRAHAGATLEAGEAAQVACAKADALVKRRPRQAQSRGWRNSRATKRG